MGTWSQLLFSSLMAFSGLAYADAGVQVQATVDRNEVGVGEVIHLTVAVSAKDSVNVEEPRLPSLVGFDLINVSTGIQTRSAYENGRFITEQSRNFIYMLAANQKGKLPHSGHSSGCQCDWLRTKPSPEPWSWTRFAAKSF